MDEWCATCDYHVSALAAPVGSRSEPALAALQARDSERVVESVTWKTQVTKGKNMNTLQRSKRRRPGGPPPRLRRLRSRGGNGAGPLNPPREGPGPAARQRPGPQAGDAAPARAAPRLRVARAGPAVGRWRCGARHRYRRWMRPHRHLDARCPLGARAAGPAVGRMCGLSGPSGCNEAFPVFIAPVVTTARVQAVVAA
jgi:hypothetical protein